MTCMHSLHGQSPWLHSKHRKRSARLCLPREELLCEWIVKIAMKYLNAQLWSHNWEVKRQIMALLMEDGRSLISGKPAAQTTCPAFWSFLPYPLLFVPLLGGFLPSFVSILFFVFIHCCSLRFSLATETYLLASWSHLCSCLVKLPPAAALRVWFSLVRRRGSSSLQECQDLTPLSTGRGLPLGHGSKKKKRACNFSCVRKCNNTVIIWHLIVHWNGRLLNF